MELTSKELRQMHLSRFGKILSNLSILALLITIGGLVGYVFVAFYYVILIIGLIASFGLILLATHGIDNLFNSAEAVMAWFNSAFSKVSLYMAPIALTIALVAIVLLAKDKKENHKARIGVGIMVIIVSVIVLIVKIVQITKGA